MAQLTPVLVLDGDQEPMATEPIYRSSDEIEDSSSNTTTPNSHLESIQHDYNKKLIALQREQRSNMGTATVFYPPTPNTSIISDDEE